MSNRDQDTGTAIAHGPGTGEVASGEGGVERNPALAALEAYRRTHPHRADEVDAAFARYDPDAPEPPTEPVAPVEDPEEQWWQR